MLETSHKVGDIIRYHSFGGIREVQVTAWYNDVKNGRAGFDAVVVSGPEEGLDVWGYASQIVR